MDRGAHAERMDRLRSAMKRKRLSALLVTDEYDLRYLTGFTGSESALLVAREEAFLLTDFRYVEEAEKTAPEATVVSRKRSLAREAARILKLLRAGRVGYRADRLTQADYAELEKLLLRSCRLVPASGLVTNARRTKSSPEIERIEKACRLAEKAFRDCRSKLRPGVSELEASARLEFQMKKLGAERAAFETIFAFDANSAMPHAHPGRTKLGRSSFGLVDWGARSGGYNCDLTRIVVSGRIPRRLRRMHGVVLGAQKAAIKRIAPGVAAREVDRAARAVIEEAGWKEAFGHSVGHGVGLEVHEGPSVSPKSKDVLKPGMVFTVEPGVYFPGFGGVRIEDVVAVTEDGCRVLTRLPRALERGSALGRPR